MSRPLRTEAETIGFLRLPPLGAVERRARRAVVAAVAERALWCALGAAIAWLWLG